MGRGVMVIDPSEKNLFLLKRGKSLFIKWDSSPAINTQELSSRFGLLKIFTR